MLSEIALDALQFFDRATLEGLQMHSRCLRDLANRHARTLPVRYIDSVQMSFGDVYIRLLEHDQSLMAAEGDVSMLFHRLNNAFVPRPDQTKLRLEYYSSGPAVVRCLMLRFGQDVRSFLYHLQANARDLQCQVGTLETRPCDEMIEHDLVHFIGIHLKPKIYVATVFCAYASDIGASTRLREGYAMLPMHSALRVNVKRLVYTLVGSVPAPDSIIPELLRVDAIKACSITTWVDPRSWIGKFIKMFKKAEPGTRIARSVILLHRRVSPLYHISELLGQPRRIDAPMPHNKFAKPWSSGRKYRRPTTETCELFVFENAKSAKKLEVLVWSVERGNEWQIALDYVFLSKLLTCNA